MAEQPGSEFCLGQELLLVRLLSFFITRYSFWVMLELVSGG